MSYPHVRYIKPRFVTFFFKKIYSFKSLGSYYVFRVHKFFEKEIHVINQLNFFIAKGNY